MPDRARSTVLTGEQPSVTEWRPVPDPTELTTQQLATAISSQRDLFETRLEAMDKAVMVLQSMANRSPTIGEVYTKFNEKFAAIEQLLSAMDNISKERFLRIDQQFIERDKRTDQLTLASSTAIAAALQAQKEAAGETQKSSAAAIAKSETSTSESIKQLQALFQTSIGGLTTQLLDLKSRLDKGEGQGVGKVNATDDYRYEQGVRRVETTDNRGLIFGIVGSVIGFGALLITLILNIARNSQSIPTSIPGIH